MHVQMNTYIHVLSLSMYFPILFTYIEYMFVQPEVNMYLKIIEHASKTLNTSDMRGPTGSSHASKVKTSPLNYHGGRDLKMELCDLKNDNFFISKRNLQLNKFFKGNTE